MSRQSRQRGFTLIEILIAVAVLAIMASIVLVTLWDAPASGRDTQRYNDLNQIALIMRLYAEAEGHWPLEDDGFSGYVSGEGIGVFCDNCSYSGNVLNTMIREYNNGNAFQDPEFDYQIGGNFYYYDADHLCVDAGVDQAFIVAHMETDKYVNYNETVGALCGTAQNDWGPEGNGGPPSFNLSSWSNAYVIILGETSDP